MVIERAEQNNRRAAIRIRQALEILEPPMMRPISRQQRRTAGGLQLREVWGVLRPRSLAWGRQHPVGRSRTHGDEGRSGLVRQDEVADEGRPFFEEDRIPRISHVERVLKAFSLSYMDFAARRRDARTGAQRQKGKGKKGGRPGAPEAENQPLDQPPRR